MSDHTRSILKQYWGFDQFRPMQEKIVDSALQNKDALALLPTGGGKSICFQVPILAQEGLGLVVSPLIALMADQVQNLKSRDIPAIAITSALHYREIDNALEACVHGRYKFLYVSPERLQSELFAERLKRMNVNLLAVDEAHCISQWGYDFRPAYLQIAQIRELLPQVPVLALTATATPEVVNDIQEKLHFAQKKVFQQSFRRANLFYNLYPTENKWRKAVDILQKTVGTGIVYMRSRKGTVQMAQMLQKVGISSHFYHAGLSSEERARRQQAWIEDKIRVMVCTNAFGMGIDKPDVRLVLHLELPDSLEAYFQEAGRAGRDGLNAHAVILLGPSDRDDLRQKSLGLFPDLPHIKKTYLALANYLNLAVGHGQNQTFAFDINDFLQQYKLPAAKTYHALDIMAKEGLIDLSTNFKVPSRLKILAGRTALYDYQLRHSKADALIKTLLRSYGGLDLEYGAIYEKGLAYRSGLDLSTVQELLQTMHERKLIDYIPQNSDSTLTFLHHRFEAKYLTISPENLQQRYQTLEKRVDAVCDYTEQDIRCRSVVLLHYFGEKQSAPCGKCDVCRAQKKTSLSGQQFKKHKEKIIYRLEEEPQSTDNLARDFNNVELYRKTLQILVDEEKVLYRKGKLHLP